MSALTPSGFCSSARKDVLKPASFWCVYAAAAKKGCVLVIRVKSLLLVKCTVLRLKKKKKGYKHKPMLEASYRLLKVNLR